MISKNILPRDRYRNDAYHELLENIEETISLREHLLQQIPDWGTEKNYIKNVGIYKRKRFF